MGQDAEVSKLTTVELARTAARAANLAVTGVDVTDYVGTIRITAASGNITAGDADSTYTTVVQTSAESGANYTNLASPYTLTAASNAGSVVSVDIPTRALKRYVRTVSNIAGANSPSFPFSITLTGYRQPR